MTVKALTDLAGMTADNVKELSAMGIESVADLSAAVKDDEKVKEIVKTLSGVGPKTVAGWKAALEGSEATETVKPAEVAVFENPVRFGYSVTKVSRDIQEAIAKSVQDMTGVAVSAVNVSVTGIAFDKAKQA